MVSDAEVFLVIIDTALEERAYEVLQASGIEVSGRFLAIEDISRDFRRGGILVTTSNLLSDHAIYLLQKEFVAIILLGEVRFDGLTTLALSEIDQLPVEISKVASKAPDPIDTDGSTVFIGVAPRVGVRTLREAIELNVPKELPSLKGNFNSGRSALYCSELDDSSIFRLFELIDADRGKYQRHGVVFTKIPETRFARDRVKAIERELEGFGISIVCTLPFDQELQVRGELSKRSRRALEPLFDWITKAN